LYNEISKGVIKVKMKILASSMAVILLLAGCKGKENQTPVQNVSMEEANQVVLSDSGIWVNGAVISNNSSDSVYLANDIVYYPEGKDFTFGEGEKKDEHSQEEADEHTVIHITKPGAYAVSGKLSKGQIAVDLGDDAKSNPDAKVTLFLNNVDLTCTVAPAVIFYNVYECGDKNEENAKKDVDTSSAGANVIIADGSVNNINGSYVARIYESVELSDDETEVVDSKKLHKYDGAFYSIMSMNINGGQNGDGVLNIYAENEGLDTELHLTLNGGIVNIRSGNDGINTNEDGVSVTTVNGGELNITVTGETGEGDGIDSNGWLVINGGNVKASACGKSADSGIDSDKGIHINGGTVMASGNMLDRIEGEQGYCVFNFGHSSDMSMNGEVFYTIKNDKGETVVTFAPQNSFTNLVISDAGLSPGEYTIWQGDTQLKVSALQAGKIGGGGMPMGEHPDGMSKGERPEIPKRPDGEKPPEMPDGNGKRGMRPGGGMQGKFGDVEYADTFTVTKGANQFIVSIRE